MSAPALSHVPFHSSQWRVAWRANLERPRAHKTPPIVLLHGIGSNAANFGPLMAALSLAHDVYAWNAPGYGASEPLEIFSPQPRDYAAALLGLLDQLELKTIILAGHSLGALFAGAFAAAYPDRVAALALLSPALGYRVKPDELLPPHVQSRIDDLDRLGPAAFAASRSARLIHRAAERPNILALVQGAGAAIHPAGYAQAVRALGCGDLLADAARITARTLVMNGAEDMVTPPAGARALHAALRNPGAYVEVADTGHALPLEATDAVAQALNDLAGEAHNV